MKVALFRFECRSCGLEQAVKAMYDPEQTSGTRIRCRDKQCRSTNYCEGPPEATLGERDD